MSTEKSGCLLVVGKLLGLFGAWGTSTASDGRADLPYRVRDDFLSPAERSFYAALVSAIADQAVICPKVNLGDILFSPGKQNSWARSNRISQKHVDFLICSRDVLRPLVALELDDSSHQRESARKRDDFKNAVFQAAGLPLVRFTAKRAYVVDKIAAQLLPLIHASRASTVIAYTSVAGSDLPICPKCGIPMVKRTASRDEQAGRPFFGCPNFPKCREILAAS
jgi:hypothetical protein